MVNGKTTAGLKKGRLCSVLKARKTINLSSSYEPTALIRCLAKSSERVLNVSVTFLIESCELLDVHQWGSKNGIFHDMNVMRFNLV